MNKTLLILVIVALLGGAVTFFVLSNRSKTTNNENTGPEVTQPTAVAPKSLKELFGLNVTQQCTFDDSAGNSGTVYVGGGQMRGDFSSTVEGKTTVSHMIVDNQTSYLWMDDQTTGFKMAFDAATPTGTTNAAGQSETNLDVNQKVDYRCQSWVANTSLFALPSGIQFSDLSKIMVSPTPSSY